MDKGVNKPYAKETAWIGANDLICCLQLAVPDELEDASAAQFFVRPRPSCCDCIRLVRVMLLSIRKPAVPEI